MARNKIKEVKNQSVKLINLIDYAIEKDVVRQSWKEDVKDCLNILFNLELKIKKSLGYDFKPLDLRGKK